LDVPVVLDRSGRLQDDGLFYVLDGGNGVSVFVLEHVRASIEGGLDLGI
jgi:hypothetical protein